MLAKYSLPEMEHIWSQESTYQKWLEIEIAVCRARAERGEIPGAAVEQIENQVVLDIDRIRDIEKETRHDLMAFVEGINRSLPDNLSRYIHKGLTSSDIKDTAKALQLKESCQLIEEDIQGVNRVLEKSARRHKHTIMMGRTHGVHAEPITWGLKLALWYQEMGRHLRRTRQARTAVSVGQISGAVGTFTSVSPRVEELVCRQLGIEPAPVSNQILQRDRHAELVSTAALIAASLEKFATEIRNLQRTDILEVEEGFRKGQKGSSAMPHKKNPIICERITGLARVIRGNTIPALENVALWHERDLTHSSAERIILPDSLILLDYMLNKMKMVLKELKVHKDNMKDNLEQTRGLIFSQKVMLALVDRGLSREQAYKLVQEKALQAWEENKDFRQLIRDDREIGRHLDQQELAAIFDYKSYLEQIDYIFERGELNPQG